MTYKIKTDKRGSWLYAFDENNKPTGGMFYPTTKQIKAKSKKKPKNLKPKE